LWKSRKRVCAGMDIALRVDYDNLFDFKTYQKGIEFLGIYYSQGFDGN
jgi:hypothetical protein